MGYLQTFPCEIKANFILAENQRIIPKEIDPDPKPRNPAPRTPFPLPFTKRLLRKAMIKNKEKL